jgi:hypothetical protein
MKKPSMKGTPLMSTSKVPDLTMTHADIITLCTLAGVHPKEKDHQVLKEKDPPKAIGGESYAIRVG